MPITIKQRDKWVKALKSPKLKQAYEVYYSGDLKDNCMCVMGVLLYKVLKSHRGREVKVIPDYIEKDKFLAYTKLNDTDKIPLPQLADIIAKDDELLS